MLSKSTRIISKFTVPVGAPPAAKFALKLFLIGVQNGQRLERHPATLLGTTEGEHYVHETGQVTQILPSKTVQTVTHIYKTFG